MWKISTEMTLQQVETRSFSLLALQVRVKLAHCCISLLLGYHVVPLSGYIKHYTTEPLDDYSIRAFLNTWFMPPLQTPERRVCAIVAVNSGLEQALQARAEAPRASRLIENLSLRISEQKQLRDLASNPLLLSILATECDNMAGILDLSFNYSQLARTSRTTQSHL